MEEKKYTPGPWYVGGITQLSTGLGYYSIHTGSDKPGTKEVARNSFCAMKLADARLIAAAPDLLEALRIAEAALNHIRCTSFTVPWEQTGPAIEQARAAIAKAGCERIPAKERADPATQAMRDEIERRRKSEH